MVKYVFLVYYMDVYIQDLGASCRVVVRNK